MSRNPVKLIPSDFRSVPSLDVDCTVSAVSEFSAELDAVAILVAPGTDTSALVDLDADALAAAGFDAEPG